MNPEIIHYMKRSDGAQNSEVIISDAVRILVKPTTSEDQDVADKLASRLGREEKEIARLEQQVIELRDSLMRARAARKHAEDALDAALSGKRRFFGVVMMKPATPGDWKGEVWLLDPEKQEKGWGLRFASVADVRREYPELWPMGKTHDGILLDATPITR